MTAVELLILLAPLLLSLFGQSSQAKLLCLVTSILALLLSVEPYGAVLPWVLGAIIAGGSVWERIQQRRMA
ncbi:MAG: hypothetical protein ABJA75_27235 [Bradyrhizobium sp.]